VFLFVRWYCRLGIMALKVPPVLASGKLCREVVTLNKKKCIFTLQFKKYLFLIPI
jgi:hypothetical protein